MPVRLETRMPVLLRPAMQRALRGAAFITMALILGVAGMSGVGPSRQDPRSGDGEPSQRRGNGAQARLMIDLNGATLQELTLLPGVGTKTAQQILDNRLAVGRFDSVEDLTRVPGIGPKTVDGIKAYCRVGP